MEDQPDDSASRSTLDEALRQGYSLRVARDPCNKGHYYGALFKQARAVGSNPKGSTPLEVLTQLSSKVATELGVEEVWTSPDSGDYFSQDSPFMWILEDGGSVRWRGGDRISLEVELEIKIGALITREPYTFEGASTAETYDRALEEFSKMSRPHRAPGLYPGL